MAEHEERDKTEDEGTKPAEPHLLPICCQLVPEVGLFRILRSKGKTLSSSSSFTIAADNNKKINQLKSEELDDSKAQANNNVVQNGIEDIKTDECIANGVGGDSKESLVADSSESVTAPNGSTSTNTMDDRTNGNGNSNGKKANSKIPQEVYEYIFIEDAVFLFERGVLECLNADSSSFTSSQLYQLIPKMGMGLAMYFVFAHLRAQDFRLLRYSPDRLPLLRKQQEKIDSVKSREFGELKKAVRKTVQNAKIPIIPNTGLSLCWEAYKPNSKFAKTHPGIPEFYVAVTYYNRPKVTFTQIQNLVQNECHGIPLKLATVSDSGTVVLLGVSPDGVPSITTTNNHIGGDNDIAAAAAGGGVPGDG